MNNEPVATMKIEYFRGSKAMTNIHLEHCDPDLPEGNYPLYTHPVKEQDGCGNCHACLVGVTEHGLPVTFQRMILCPDCGNKRCPKASNHRYQCTESNEPNQRGSIYTHPAKEHFEDEPQAEELHEIMQSNAELTDELNNLKKENKFFKEILSEMDKQVYNIEFLKQPMQILEDGQIVPVFKELTDEEINKLWAESHEDGIATQQGFTTQQHYFANLILRKASEKC